MRSIPVSYTHLDVYKRQALLYAGDRAEAAPMIRRWLEAGKFVIVDRYVYSNVGYQCAKIDAPADRERLREWIIDLEYGHNGIPQPDLSLFLDEMCIRDRLGAAGTAFGQAGVNESSLLQKVDKACLLYTSLEVFG